ncbi:LysR family transcriptional regulator [Aquabacter spiritensis]|uniref:DNA-binding transcriptional LysR family regulator n=1 Tax=Aquabacter spiritensis TaxID=933073 RepID=A0A4R3LJS0_9HYPH|nr:LysR family transcriptional regulator [Aquabacter spiritensis]TCT00520.1 DNA-binding transcriptional LysR family regulator [Aquabacter spiritensis]
MRFDLADLRLFLAVVEAGSITAGAAEANLSLAAASERLREMEAAGGVALLVRGRRGTLPTQAGETLAHHARRVLREMARLKDELGAHAAGLRVRIRLLANTAALTECLPDRLGGWLAAHPRIDVDLKERTSVEIAAAVSGGLADIGILSEAAATSSLHLVPFARDQLVVVAARDHALAGARRVGFADLLGQRFVGLTGGAIQDHLEAQAARLGRRMVYRIKVRTFEAVCRLAAHGVGLGIVPATAARRSRGRSAFATLRLSDGWSRRRLCICHRRDAELSPVARDLIRHLSEPVRRPGRGADPSISDLPLSDLPLSDLPTGSTYLLPFEASPPARVNTPE